MSPKEVQTYLRKVASRLFGAEAVGLTYRDGLFYLSVQPRGHQIVPFTPFRKEGMAGAVEGLKVLKLIF